MTREEFISQMGYRDDSPLRNEDSLNIRTGPNGIIDMTNTGIPLMANGRYLPPYSGHHQFEPNSIVTEIPMAQDGLESMIRKKIGHTQEDMDASHDATIKLIKEQDWKNFQNAWPKLSKEEKKEIKDHWATGEIDFSQFGTNLTDEEKFGYYEATNRYYDKFNHAINMYNMTKNQGSGWAKVGAWGHEAGNLVSGSLASNPLLLDGLFGTHGTPVTSGDSGTDMRNNYLGINAANSGMSYEDFLKSLVEEGVYQEQYQGSVFDRGWSDLITDWFGDHKRQPLDLKFGGSLPKFKDINSETELEEEIIQGGMLPEVEVSALTDESYNKLSQPQQSLYDTFVTPGGIAQTVDIGETYEENSQMHWKDALRMADDLNVRKIYNEPNLLGRMFSNKFNRHGNHFRAHANPILRNIHVPKLVEPGDPEYRNWHADLIEAIKLGQAYWVKQMTEEERVQKIRALEDSVENAYRDSYFQDIIAEFAHIPEFWRSESFYNLPKSWKNDAIRFFKGEETDHSRYFDKDHYEYLTHNAPNSFEKQLRREYKTYKDGGSLPKFQDINSETELYQMIEDMEINTQDVDDTEQKEFQRTKIGSDEWLNRVIREQEDRGNPVTKAQAIQFQNQALSDLDQGVVKSQTWDEFFGNPISGGSGMFDFGTQGFNITTPSIWDPKIEAFRPDPSGQIGNTMLINDFAGNDPNPWTFAHETGHNWNWRNPFNNDETSQFLGNTYFGKDNMFNKFNPDLTSTDYDHDRNVGFSGRQINMGDFGQYQQSSPEIRSEKAALEKELFDLGLYDPTKPFTEQNLRDILESRELSSNAREVLDGLGFKDLLKEKYDVYQATSNFEDKNLPTELRGLRTKIEQMYSELGSRYNENAHMDANTWHNMSERERKEHNEEFGTTLREVPDGWGGTMTVEMSDLEYAEALREQARSADLELYGEDAVYGTNALSGWDIDSPGHFAYEMGNITDVNTTLDYYMNDFMNSTTSAPLLQEVKDAEGIIIGYTDDPNYGGFGSTEGINIIPYSNETKTQFENQNPTGGPTEAEWTTYVDNLFTENESYIADDPESTWGMKIDESLDYTWPSQEGDDDYDPNNIQVNNSLYDLCYDDNGNPTGNPDCTDAQLKRLEDNQSRHEKHRKIDQLGWNANAIVDLFGTSTMVHIEHDQDIFNMDAGVVKTAPTMPLIEGMYSELYPEGSEQYEARQRLMQTMTRLRAKEDSRKARLDRESLTPQFIQDMQVVEDALRNTRLKLQERRQGYVKEYYDGVKKYRGADHEQLIEEQQLELDEKIKNNNITNFMNRVYSQNDQQISDDIPQTMNARYGKELPRFQKKGEYDWDGWKIATEKSIYPDGEWNWYNPADSWRWLTNENETIPLSPPLPEDPESAKNKSEIPLSWDEYKIEKPKGTIEQYRRYIRNPKYNDWRMHSFDPYTNITKKGWANKEYYRGLDGESIGEVQDWLIEHGYDIKKDNDWGDDTYNALNNYLLDTKLLNKEITSHPLVTDDILINQQYIESDGKPEAGSHKGALGLVQAMPGAWKDAIRKGIIPENAKRTNINHALAFQRYYMNSLMNAEFVTDATSNNEKLARALSAYNWGRGNTPRFFKKYKLCCYK